jgi:hypothetical protein
MAAGLLLIVGLSSYLISMGSNHAEVEGLVGNKRVTSPLLIPTARYFNPS